MADVSKINLYGTDYSIKDSTARNAANNAATSASEAKTAANNAATSASEAKTAANNAQNTADSANNKATTNATNITKLSTEGIVIAYESTDESINVSKGITL